MSDKKISGFPVVDKLTGTDGFSIVQNGGDRKITTNTRLLCNLAATAEYWSMY